MRQLSLTLRRQAKSLSLPLISIVVGFLIGGLIIAISGYNPFSAIGGILKGGFGSGYNLTTTLTRATPIVFAGLAAALAWGSGYPSMGAAGQMALGALTSAIVAVWCPGPPVVVCVVSLISGAAVGMLVALFSAFICDRFGLWLLIVTLMLNYVCENVCSYLTTYVVKDPQGVDASAIQTQRIVNGNLPRLFPQYTLHAGFLLAVVAVFVIAFIMRKTSFGYKAKMTGLNPEFANYGGISSHKMMFLVMMLSGALAGLGGACEVLGTRYRYVDAMISSPGYAWTGVITALMSSHNPIGVLLSAIFLGGITTGGSAIQRSMGLSADIVSIISGVITLLVTVKFVIHWNHPFHKSRQRGGQDVK